MSQPKQIKPKPLELSEEELAKVAEARERNEGVKVEPEWFALAEFGYYFGWEGVKAVRNNEINIDEMIMLSAGARKVWAGKALDIANASFLGAVSAQSTKPNKAFNRGIKSFVRAARVNE